MNHRTTIAKWFPVLLLLLTVSAADALAQSLTVGNLSIKAGGIGTVDIVLAAEEGQAIYGVQTDIVLSDGLSLENASAYDENLFLAKNKLNSGAVRLIELSLSGQEISAGAVIQLKIKAADDFAGNGTIALNNTKITIGGGDSEMKQDNVSVPVSMLLSLTMNDLTIKAGESAQAAIHLSTESPVYGVQTDVQLSEGLTVTDAGDAQFYQVGNVVHIVLYNMDGITTGDIINLTIEASATARNGVVKVKNTKVTTSLNPLKEETLDDETATVTVLTKVMMIVTEAQWATFIAPFDVAKPDGVAVYTVDGVGEDNVLTMTELETSIPANTPVVLNSESVIEAELADVVTTTAENLTNGLLTGTYTEIAAPDGSYILQNHDGSVAFYRVDTNEATPKVPAYRAYLTAPSKARALYFGVETTAVKAVEALISGGTELYDLNGHRLPKLQKGMNIIRTPDGHTQKVMVK